MNPRTYVTVDAVERLMARWFPGEGCRVEPVAAGVSTPVFRVWRDDTVAYLRLAEEPRENRTAEARVHELLMACGVPVPAVVRFEPMAPEVGRSAMLTGELPGAPLAEIGDERAACRTAEAAGRDLARINAVPVRGYGWANAVGSDGALVAAYPTRGDWTAEYIDAVSVITENRLLPGMERMLEGAVERWARRAGKATAWLAHGDFDTTHIFTHDAAYTGIIDFGESRGADRLYDLGHFLLHDGERLPYPLFPSLLAGYREASVLPPEAPREIRLHALVIGVQRLARAHRQGRSDPYRCWLEDRIQRMLSDLDRDAWVLTEADSVD
ncbi:MAG: aminoglycoside phosphotransferase family protein [Chloroflexia bacterium]|nr:aminoglycoside phosphotransferase family protein [Chloroflexia bacterium]